jgi:hypothetical protein
MTIKKSKALKELESMTDGILTIGNLLWASAHLDIFFRYHSLAIASNVFSEFRIAIYFEFCLTKPGSTLSANNPRA